MTAVLVWILLILGVLSVLTGVLGVLVAGNVYDRLHFIGPSGIFGPFCLALAVVIDEGPL